MADYPELSKYVTANGTLAVRVTPKAARNKIVVDEGTPVVIRVYVTVVPEDGKANAAVIKLLAKALGVAKSRLELMRGGSGRDKVFRIT